MVYTRGQGAMCLFVFVIHHLDKQCFSVLHIIITIYLG